MKAISARARYDEKLVKKLFSSENAHESVKMVLTARRDSKATFKTLDGRVLSTVRISQKRAK